MNETTNENGTTRTQRPPHEITGERLLDHSPRELMRMVDWLMGRPEGRGALLVLTAILADEEDEAVDSRAVRAEGFLDGAGDE